MINLMESNFLFSYKLKELGWCFWHWMVELYFLVLLRNPIFPRRIWRFFACILSYNVISSTLKEQEKQCMWTFLFYIRIFYNNVLHSIFNPSSSSEEASQPNWKEIKNMRKKNWNLQQQKRKKKQCKDVKKEK